MLALEVVVPFDGQERDGAVGLARVVEHPWVGGVVDAAAPDDAAGRGAADGGLAADGFAQLVELAATAEPVEPAEGVGHGAGGFGAWRVAGYGEAVGVVPGVGQRVYVDTMGYCGR